MNGASLVTLRYVFLSILGFTSALFAHAQQPFIEHTKTWHEPRAAYLDSIYDVFNHPKSDRQKLEVALQLYRELNFSAEKAGKLALKMDVSVEEVERWQRLFKDHVVTELSKDRNKDLREEYELLSLRSLDQVNRVKQMIDPYVEGYATKDSTFRAIWLMRKQFYLRKERPNQSRSGLLHQALNHAPKTEENLALVSNICRALADPFYHQRQLDSAQYYYEIAAKLYDRNKSKVVQYIPAYGIHERTEVMGNILMNLGLVHERKGNLIGATTYYEEANLLYANKNKEGTQWSNMRLMNAFFDMGDHRSGTAWIRKIANESMSDLKGIPRYTPRFIVSVLAELDLDEIKDNGELLDSILTAEIDYLYKEEPLGSVEEKKLDEERYVYYRARICQYRLLLGTMGFGSETAPLGLDELNYWVSHYLQKSKEDSRKFFNTRSMESLILTWKTVQTSEDSAQVYFNRLLHLFQGQELNSEASYAVKQASWLLHQYGKYQEELVLLNILLGEAAKTSHKVEHKKLYRQLAAVHEKLGQYEQAIAFRNQYEDLATEIQNINQYASLAALDKKLEVAKSKRDQAILQMEFNALKGRRTRLLLVVVALSIILALGAGFVWANRKRVMARKKQLEAEKELLSADLKHEAEKVRLASIEILKGNQSFSQLITDVENLKTELSPDNRKKVLGLLINYKSKSQDDIWQQFNLQFQSHYQRFYQNLSAQFPALTESEQRLCAMHLSGLNNNEINAITGQKLSSIHTMKSKVRKKMGVENDQELSASLQGMV